MKFDKNFKQFGWWGKALLQKFYFDKGWSILTYVKYFVVAFGAISFFEKQDKNLLLMLGLGYGIVCYFVGFVWAKYLIMAENEIQNQFNLFQKEVRKKLKKT